MWYSVWWCSQQLRGRLNNHRNSLKKLTNLYLYRSDGHSVDDISIEEITSSDRVSATSKRLEREDYGVGNFVLTIRMG